MSVRVALLALIIGGFAALGSTAMAGSKAATGTTAHSAHAGLITSARCKRNKAAGTINYISPFGYDAAATIMEVFKAQHLGYFNALCLKVSFNASSFTSEQLVSSGRGQVTAIGSAADHILSVAAGANLTAVATYGDTDPHAIYAQTKIKSLKDLEGGTLGYHTNITPAAIAMLVKAGAGRLEGEDDPADELRPDRRHARSDRRCCRLRIQRAAAAEGDRAPPFKEFKPSDFGIKGTYSVMQWNTTWYRKHKAVVGRLHAGRPEGARTSASCTRSQCVKYISHLAAAANQGAAFPYARQLATWNYESQYVTNDKVGGYGVQTIAEWQTEYQEVQKYGTMAGLTASNKVPPLASVMDTKLVAGLYTGTKLNWPGK